MFHGESDEFPGREAGDVIIVVNEKPHKLFKRKGADLFFEKEITLLESLTGVEFALPFLDGTTLKVVSPKGQVIKPDMLMTIEEKGLPFYKNPYKFGNLVVLFSVKFPTNLNENQISGFQNILKDQKKDTNIDMDAEETVNLTPYDDS